ncbi:MAG TPA: hypothetical protein VF461_15870 [Gemmatimonadaceae bacterium]
MTTTSPSFTSRQTVQLSAAQSGKGQSKSFVNVLLMSTIVVSCPAADAAGDADRAALPARSVATFSGPVAWLDSEHAARTRRGTSNAM